MGGLLLEFGVTLCGSGLELEVKEEGESELWVAHAGMLLLQAGLLVAMVRKEAVGRMVRETVGIKSQ